MDVLRILVPALLSLLVGILGWGAGELYKLRIETTTIGGRLGAFIELDTTEHIRFTQRDDAFERRLEYIERMRSAHN